LSYCPSSNIQALRRFSISTSGMQKHDLSSNPRIRCKRQTGKSRGLGNIGKIRA